MKINTRKSTKKGFSLVEMLVVIAVIGILTAIAIPIIGRINDQANNAKDARNVQAFATMYNAAKAAGVTDADLSGDTVATAVADLQGGVTFTDPITGNVVQFQLDLDATEVANITANVTVANGTATL